MKILVISSKYPPEYSGSGLRAHNTYKRLREKFKISFDVVANSVEFNNNVRYEYDGISVIRFGKKLPLRDGSGILVKVLNHFTYLVNFIYQGFYTWRVLSKGNYDLIHTFGSSISVNVGMLFAKYNGKALLREVCNNGTKPQPKLPLKLDRILPYKFKSNSKVVAISQRIGDFCRSEGVDERHLWQRPNPVNEQKFNPIGQEKYVLRKKLSRFENDDKVLLNIGKFGPGKNQIFLIKTMGYLEESYKLLLFGPLVTGGPFYERDKAYFASLMGAIEKDGLSERVQVVKDFINSIEEYYKMADVFVFPTLFEALGTPMLESIACGVPVVANRIEGVTDYWIEQGKTGFVCELQPGKFAECIVMASEIAPDTLRQGSKQILSRASDQIIDKQYLTIMQDITNSVHRAQKSF
ncbi:MAG: glycosyltransferase family 4 protein [bacterium]|nr:MAG: glycosyltransferase family 4 protein [bacterium]